MKRTEKGKVNAKESNDRGKLKGKGQEREKGKEKTLIFESLYLATQCRNP